MTKEDQLREIQRRLPEDIKIVDETNFDFTEDEFVCILSWVKYFNSHYKDYGKEKPTRIMFPIISKRLRLDFGLYLYPNEKTGDYNIYLSMNGKRLDGKVVKESCEKVIRVWKL